MASGIIITNFTNSIRTNADFQTAGLQTTCLAIDNLGIVEFYDDEELHFYGDGYIDTQWIPQLDNRVIIEIGQDKELSTVNNLNGLSDTSPDEFLIGYLPSGDMYMNVMGGTFSSPVDDDYHLIVVDASGTDFTPILDGVAQLAVPYTLTTPTKSFLLGTQNVASKSFSTGSIDRFVVLDETKAEQYDALQSYNAYVGV